MGYTSEVAFVIEFDDEKKAQQYFETINFGDLQYLKSQLEVKGKYLTYTNESIKWYEDYEDIKALSNIFKTSIEEGAVGYVFKRLGEDLEDYEEISDCRDDGVSVPPWSCIDVVRTLQLCI